MSAVKASKTKKNEQKSKNIFNKVEHCELTNGCSWKKRRKCDVANCFWLRKLDYNSHLWSKHEANYLCNFFFLSGSPWVYNRWVHWESENPMVLIYIVPTVKKLSEIYRDSCWNTKVMDYWSRKRWNGIAVITFGWLANVHIYRVRKWLA